MALSWPLPKVTGKLYLLVRGTTPCLGPSSQTLWPRSRISFFSYGESKPASGIGVHSCCSPRASCPERKSSGGQTGSRVKKLEPAPALQPLPSQATPRPSARQLAAVLGQMESLPPFCLWCMYTSILCRGTFAVRGLKPQKAGTGWFSWVSGLC